MQEGVPEPHQLPPATLHEWARDYVAANDVVLKLTKRHSVEARVGIGVIGELEAGVEPLVEHRGTLVALTGDIDLPFVDEDRGGDLLRLQRCHESCRDSLKVADIPQ